MTLKRLKRWAYFAPPPHLSLRVKTFICFSERGGGWKYEGRKRELETAK